MRSSTECKNEFAHFFDLEPLLVSVGWLLRPMETSVSGNTSV